MARLVDYFVVVGYDLEKKASGDGQGKIIQRFPDRDWEDTPFPQGIQLFCQPGGWQLCAEWRPASFFVAMLTDIESERHFCACLTFWEEIPELQNGGREEANADDDHMPTMLRFAPKSLVLVSRLGHTEIYRNCLGLIYAIHVDKIGAPLEVVVANLATCIVPVSGGLQRVFSLGAGDRQVVLPPLNNEIPSTGCSVFLLFQQLGINNVLHLFCAVLTEQKILFHSSSYQRLTEACRALVAVVYPLKYSYTYVPILPGSLLEVLSTPTPFIIGVHSTFKSELQELLDVIIADLDGGTVSTPECVHVSTLPEPYLQQIQNVISTVLHPDLAKADLAFPTSSTVTAKPEMLDKEVRATFLRLFAQLLQGYRSCLQLVRIHAEPVIKFHKAAFLGHRGLVDSDFLPRLLDSMAFAGFVSERGPPYRTCELFDELVASSLDWTNNEEEDPAQVRKNVRNLAKQLYDNELPSPLPVVQRVRRPNEGQPGRPWPPPFPRLEEGQVESLIMEGLARLQGAPLLARPERPCTVPAGAPIAALHYGPGAHSLANNVRRLEVVRNCVTFVFESKLLEAKKTLPAVLRALKGRAARQCLVQELGSYAQQNRAVLDHQQFDYVVRMMNCALQDCTPLDEHSVVSALLPLATTFCRKLCPGVTQFAYTCIQEHAVWTNQQFWEAAFYDDVQKHIQSLYLSMADGRQQGQHTHTQKQQKTPMEIAAEQLRLWPTLDSAKQQELIASEESIVYSQAIHYANRMVNLLVPLDTNKNRLLFRPGLGDGESVSNSFLNSSSIADSVAESYDTESGFEDSEGSDVANSVVRLITRFVDKVCTESKVTSDHIRALDNMIPGTVAIHIETLESVHRESRRLPPVEKPRIMKPVLLPGENFVLDSLRVYLLPDGREEVGGALGGPCILPAEGAIFLTNYRIIFKGKPIDPLIGEQLVIRSFPVSALTKEKKITVTSQLEHYVQEGLQLRSCTFELLKVAFDMEVGSETVEMFRKQLHRLRYPQTVFYTFAFSTVQLHSSFIEEKQKEQSTGLRTLMKSAKRAGMKTIMRPHTSRKKFTPPSWADRPCPCDSDDEDQISVSDEGDKTLTNNTLTSTTLKSPEKMAVDHAMERACCRDYQRLGLGTLSSSLTRSKSELFRISTLNRMYAICQSYPGLVIVPQNIQDVTLHKIARCYRHNRFPVVLWRHTRTKAVLLRSSAAHGKGVAGLFKGQAQHTSGASSSESSSSVEQEKYLQAIIHAMPNQMERNRFSVHSSALLSLDSEAAYEKHHHLRLGTLMKQATGTSVDFSLPNSFTRGVLGYRDKLFTVSSTKSSFKDKMLREGKWSSLRGSARFGSPAISSEIGARLAGKEALPTLHNGMGSERDLLRMQSIALYILTDKSQGKAVRLEAVHGCEVCAVDYPDVRAVKGSFKKLLRVCVPSAIPGATDASFLQSLQESEWLQQIQRSLQLAVLIVELLDSGTSVCVSLEEGWDITTQLVSLTQVLLDPYYRTLEGFRLLVEKEWISFGHRFCHRNNQTLNFQGRGLAPIFLQFLDCVHQIHHQFPLEFEFNSHYLKFIAYHYVSNRFKTFLLNSDYERIEMGMMYEEKGEKLGPRQVKGLWDCIDRLHRTSPVFYNYLYTPSDGEEGLQPLTAMPALRLWDFFIEETLGEDTWYDWELQAGQFDEDGTEDEQHTGSVPRSKRKTVWPCYNNVSRQQPDAITQTLKEIEQLENNFVQAKERWKEVWDKAKTVARPEQEQLALLTPSVPRRRRSAQMFPMGHNPVPLIMHTHPTIVSNAPGSLSSPRASSSANYGPFSSPHDVENRSFEGFLFKRGALLKGWKQRWFVLDKTKHQLRYYDNVEDLTCKGIIDLAEVETVAFGAPSLGAPKMAEEKAFFDLKTTKRVYNFFAKDPQMAQQWLDKIQSCLSDA